MYTKCSFMKVVQFPCIGQKYFTNSVKHMFMRSNKEKIEILKGEA